MENSKSACTVVCNHEYTLQRTFGQIISDFLKYSSDNLQFLYEMNRKLRIVVEVKVVLPVMLDIVNVLNWHRLVSCIGKQL